jgi:hypothetical protein
MSFVLWGFGNLTGSLHVKHDRVIFCGRPRHDLGLMLA